MPTQNISDKKIAAIITAGMNNTPSSEALMKYSKNYRKDDENRIYRQLPDNSSEIHLSGASSFSGGILLYSIEELGTLLQSSSGKELSSFSKGTFTTHPGEELRKGRTPGLLVTVLQEGADKGA